jgi:glycerol-3-phosphate dehydrogenase (NAD(P)+)
MNELKIGVIGDGSWATAIVKILLNNNNKINWWIREQEIIEHLLTYGHNPFYLSSVEFETDRLNLSNKIEEVVEQSDIIVLVVPAVFLHETLRKIPKGKFINKTIVTGIKGIVPEYNIIVADYLNNHFAVDFKDIIIIGGPSHAEEVAAEKLTYLTIASQDAAKAEMIASLFQCRHINAGTSDDIFGTEYSAVIKNIVAIACGICVGLGYGDNFQAVLVSNAIQEIKRFVDAVHPIQRDIKDSVYLGDLIVTAYSQYSRNRTFGNMIGKGYTVKFAQLEMKMIAEGYYAAKCIHEINEAHNVYMPITDAVYNILYKNSPAAFEIKNLVSKLS